MHLIFTIIILLGFVYVCRILAKLLHIPSVVGFMISGIILGSEVLINLVISPNEIIILNVGNIGLIILMFMAGFESSWTFIVKEKKDAVIHALSASIIPFLLGIIIFKFLLNFSWISSLIVGICLSITAEATKADVLLELNKIKTKVGSAMMGAGILDDIIGLSVFIVVSYFLKDKFVKEDILIAGVILAFFLGILLQTHIKKKTKAMEKIEKTLLITIVPFFFITIGIELKLFSMMLNISLLVIIILIAIMGKIIGILITKPFGDFSWKQLYLIGWGMNSRGAVELAIALVAFRTGLINSEIYSSLIIMALITTLIFPFIVSKMIKKDKDIMN